MKASCNEVLSLILALEGVVHSQQIIVTLYEIDYFGMSTKRSFLIEMMKFCITQL